MSEGSDLLSRMTWLMSQTVLKHVLLMKAKRSTFKMKYFVKKRKDPLLIMTWVMSQWWWTRRTWTSEFHDYHIPLWSTRRVPAFENWFRKWTTIQIDMLFNKIYDKINHLILSVQNQNKWYRMWVTSNYVNCSTRNRQRSAPCDYHTGTSVYSTARAGISCKKKEGPIENSSIIRWTFHSLSVSSRMEDLMDVNMVRSWETKNLLFGYPIEEEMQKDGFPRNPWPIHTRSRIPYSKDWKPSRRRPLSTMGCSCGWRSLTIWPHKNTSTMRANGGFIQKSKNLILCHWGIDLISSRHCLLGNDCNKKQKKNHRCLRTLLQRPTMGGAQFIFCMLELARFMVDSLSFRKSRPRGTKYWVNGATCYLQYLARYFGERLSWIFVPDWSFTADGGLL